MAKERVQVSPPTEVNSTEGLQRSFSELNARLEWITARLPSLTQATAVDLRSQRSPLSGVVNRKAVTVARVIENPVDLNALKTNLSNQVVPSIESELETLRADLKDVARIVAKLIDMLAD